MKNRVTLVVFVCFLLFVILLGLGMMWLGKRAKQLTAATATWKETTGEVLSREDTSLNSGAGSLHLKYKYTDDTGASHTNARISYDFGGDTSGAVQFVDSMGSTQRVKVWYDPKDPEKAVLINYQTSRDILIKVGLVFEIFGGMFLFLIFHAFLRRFRSRSGVSWN
jgi:hypothetical protein